MTDQSLIALARQWAHAAFNAGQYVERGPESHIYNHFATEAENASIAFAAALAREQEAQPAPIGYWHNQSTGNLHALMPAWKPGAAQPAAQQTYIEHLERRCAELAKLLDDFTQPAAQEPSEERAEPQGLTGLLDDAIDTVGRFVSDEGWQSADMDVLDALIAARATAGSKP